LAKFPCLPLPPLDKPAKYFYIFQLGDKSMKKFLFSVCTVLAMFGCSGDRLSNVDGGEFELQCKR